MRWLMSATALIPRRAAATPKTSLAHFTMPAPTAALAVIHRRLTAGDVDKVHEQAVEGTAVLKTSKGLAYASKKASRKAASRVLCVPVQIVCCFCTSIRGVLELMRSENTREFALAVVVGNAFESFITSFAADVIFPSMMYLYSLTRAVADLNIWRSLVLGCIGSSCSGWLLIGGEVYQTSNTTLTMVEYATNDAAAADGAQFINVASFIQSTISFILQVRAAVRWCTRSLRSLC